MPWQYEQMWIMMSLGWVDMLGGRRRRATMTVDLMEGSGPGSWLWVGGRKSTEANRRDPGFDIVVQR